MATRVGIGGGLCGRLDNYANGRIFPSLLRVDHTIHRTRHVRRVTRLVGDSDEARNRRGQLEAWDGSARVREWLSQGYGQSRRCDRSEERRVGKEGRCWWEMDHYRK